MIYITKGEVNELVLNINNNARPNFTTYDLVFTHIMSKEMKTYTINTNNPNQYFSNIRYCQITLDLTNNDLNYEGEYQLNIFGDGTYPVFTGISILQGMVEQPSFTEYISPNEDNSNYIYIQD